MILWTIQPESVYELIQSEGVYHCDIEKASFYDLKMQYDWLVQEMKKRIGKPPKGVTYPVWAWYMWEGRRMKPDLRSERWGNGWKGDRFACMEIDIPDEKVLLSDFDDWSMILLDAFLSDSEIEDERLENEYSSLPQCEKTAYKCNNWKRAFRLEYLDNGWTHRGDSIQATFWELKKEDIKNVRFFSAASERPKL